MEPTELLEHGRDILAAALEPHGFVFERGIADTGSGGRFAQGAFVRPRHRLEFSVRRALGEVLYRVGHTAITHEDLMRVVAGPRLAHYPGFSADPLDGFRHLRADLETYGDALFGRWTRTFPPSRSVHSRLGRAADLRGSLIRQAIRSDVDRGLYRTEVALAANGNGDYRATVILARQVLANGSRMRRRRATTPCQGSALGASLDAAWLYTHAHE